MSCAEWMIGTQDSQPRQKAKTHMTTKQKTDIVTGCSQGIGAAAPYLFLDRGYNVLGNSRKISHKNELQRSNHLALVDGDFARLV
jgi:NAD(P)-dependent dehydrogenase (short-subunit alcohol dehydrogenase family)